MLARAHGATAAYTPMLHARLFAEVEKYRAEHFTTTSSAVDRSGDRLAACLLQTKLLVLRAVMEKYRVLCECEIATVPLATLSRTH